VGEHGVARRCKNGYSSQDKILAEGHVNQISVPSCQFSASVVPISNPEN